MENLKRIILFFTFVVVLLFEGLQFNVPHYLADNSKGRLNSIEDVTELNSISTRRLTKLNVEVKLVIKSSYKIFLDNFSEIRLFRKNNPIINYGYTLFKCPIKSYLYLLQLY